MSDYNLNLYAAYNVCAACGKIYSCETNSQLCPECQDKANGQNKARTSSPHVQHEAAEQTALFEWAAYMSSYISELKLLFHIPNGGSRNKFEARSLKKQGVKAGVPDLFLPVPRGKYHGLFIEMKAGKNSTSKEQNTWLSDLTQQGYKCAVCYGWDNAKAEICKYLSIR